MTGVDRFLSFAGSVGGPFYKEFPPSNDLQLFVACTWVRLVRHRGSEARDAILPDGCADIMVYDDQPPRIAGPDAFTRWEKLNDGLVITGIRLRPGACRSILGCPAERLADCGILLSDVATGATELHRKLLLSDTLFARLALLESWVRLALERATAKDHAVIAACHMLVANPMIEIDDVARHFGWNARMIHRQFITACGYSPKHFQRIMRVQSAIRMGNSNSVKGLGELAAAAGYADQAHMTRDFRNITGFTPAAYLADTPTPGLSAWIDEDW
jgi:AraC-like DNA-binding protein